MVERISALASDYAVGKHGILGADGEANVVLQTVPNLQLYQVAAWPDTVSDVATAVADELKLKTAPNAGQAVTATDIAMLRVEPLKWWVLGVVPSPLAPEIGCTLDLSHSKTHIRISGQCAVELLNSQLPLDLREQAFPVNSVATSVIHHVGVTLWRSQHGYELFLPRGFALSLWQGLVASAKQFGLQIVSTKK